MNTEDKKSDITRTYDNENGVMTYTWRDEVCEVHTRVVPLNIEK